jgi:hypothetical protein
MASGFTSEILNGNVKTLNDFIVTCSKGFGATAHQQSEPLNTPLRDAVADETNKKAAAKLKRQLKKFKLMTDEELHADEEKALNKSKQHFVDKIELMKEAKKKCAELLLEAQLWTPPTDEHKVVKDFMIKELKSVIDFDCDIKPVNTLIEDIDGRLATIDVKEIRNKQIESFEQQIDYHTQTYKMDVLHVEQSNNWLSELKQSLK